MTKHLVKFDDLNPGADDYASQLVDRILKSAMEAEASDVHLTQHHGVLQLRFRVGGRLIELCDLPDGKSTSVLARIKALARLITYRTDIPQEGRLVISDQNEHLKMEARVGTLPTLHGERAVIRLSLATSHDWMPEQLGLPADALDRLHQTLRIPSGVILICGPAGSGKTTTAYACLRKIIHSDQPRCLVSLEDPVEAEIAGVAQSQINPAAHYGWSTGLKALLRQDPEVMFVGEIRDGETAAVVFQAAMTGQLVITTLHARSCVDALRRLMDMGVPVQHLRGGLDYLVCQRLLPKICECQRAEAVPLPKCPRCQGCGTDGRHLIAECLPPIEGDLGKLILQDADSGTLQNAAQSQGMLSLATLSRQAVAQGWVSPADVANGI